MQSSPEATSLLSGLRATLARMMDGATFTEEALSEGRLPVLLMQREHAITAFAVGDQDDYLPLYAAFKKYYLKYSAQWSTKDLAFVYCIPPGIKVEPDFSSRVEVDVYFCRKYAVHLDSNLSASLARLPFLPLAPITPGVQTRPPSAQKLLRHRNLKAELATALVVPQRSSAASILKACLAGTYGSPHPLETTAVAAPAPLSGEDRVQATLKSISVQNFRAYRTKKEFKFGSAVTVLYGPNGFGKTSFFDAIDFAVTGSVGRLQKAGGGLSRVAKHLDCDDDTTEVSLTLVRDGAEYVITRTLADYNNAKVNGKVLPRKEVLSLLTGGITPGADRVESMVDLFRATHLFSQENQELTRDVASKCELSAELVTKMLAFEDYASGLKKAEEVLKLANQECVAANADVVKARSDIEAEQLELSRLEGLVATDTSSEALDARFADLEQAISAAGFALSAIEIRDTRGIRAMLESSAAHSVALRTSLSRAVEQVGALEALRKQQEQIQTQLAERLNSLQQTEAEEAETIELLNMASAHLAQLRSQESSLQNRLDWFNWAASVQPEYAQLNEKLQNLSESLTSLASQAAQQRVALDQAQSVQRQAASTLQTAEADLKAASARRASVQSLEEAATLWSQSAPVLAELESSVPEAQAILRTLREQREVAQEAVRAQTVVLDRAEREVNDAKDSRNQVNALVAELRGHVDGSTCQMCGHDHGSMEALLQAIDRRFEQADRVLQLLESAAKERSTLELRHDQMREAVERCAQHELRVAQLLNQQAELAQKRSNYETSLTTIGLALTSQTPQQLKQLSSQVHEHERLAAGTVSTRRESLASADTAVFAAQAGLQEILQRQKVTEEALESAKQRLNELVSDANRGSVSLASSLQVLTDARDAVEMQLHSARAAVGSAVAQYENQKAVHAATKAAVVAARTSHLQAAQEWTAHEARVQAILSELAAANFDSSVTQDELRQRIEVEAGRAATALNLAGKVAELEVAVDTAATSAAFQSIRQRIQDKEKLVQEATARAQELHPWVAYFTEITKLLSTQQSFATEHFIDQYGPRTAVIQQRLRPVYGFDGIEVTSKDKTISISVNRKDEKLRPTDYFSQSQVQTLVLGLFLTACSSQTWSGFSSIMMDDPVTHFDDLNTYALLDLILGLQSSSEGERQFVISTCDEKLLQLARHKFRHLGSAAKFYRFQAIGLDGPMVSEISA